jgi:hypothetical protein
MGYRCKVSATVFPSRSVSFMFGEHSKTGKTRFSVCPYLQVTAYSVNVLLGNSRIWEALKNPRWQQQYNSIVANLI